VDIHLNSLSPQEGVAFNSSIPQEFLGLSVSNLGSKITSVIIWHHFNRHFVF
jgi:hypothetical protein